MDEAYDAIHVCYGIWIANIACVCIAVHSVHLVLQHAVGMQHFKPPCCACALFLRAIRYLLT